ncbi:MAG: ribonuclease III [Candidatus Kaiserbacteria bacterium]|nr:ribonuclease III [Candidatus Kaiserbacteria bacterium]
MRKKSVREIDTAVVESAIGYTFSDKNLLTSALTHRSFLNEHKAVEHNERLEFLGDAVLQLVSTQELFNRYPDESEGDLSLSRSRLVRTDFLANAAKDLGLHEHLRASAGQTQEMQKGVVPSLLANTTEAVIGAIYRDGGLGSATAFILEKVLTDIPGFLAATPAQDAKTALQELVQQQQQITPTYTTLATNGPDNERTFTVGVQIGDTVIGKGEGHSKQEAEQRAAQQALDNYTTDAE